MARTYPESNISDGTMDSRTNNDRPTLALLGGRRITGLHIARMFRALTGRTMTTAQVLEAQQSLDRAYAELEERRMAKPKDEKPGKVDYGKLTAEALRKHQPCPPAKPPTEKETEEKEQ